MVIRDQYIKRSIRDLFICKILTQFNHFNPLICWPEVLMILDAAFS